VKGIKTEEAMAKRLGNAAAELEYGKADGAFDRVSTNDDLDKETFDEFIECSNT